MFSSNISSKRFLDQVKKSKTKFPSLFKADDSREIFPSTEIASRFCNYFTNMALIWLKKFQFLQILTNLFYLEIFQTQLFLSFLSSCRLW